MEALEKLEPEDPGSSSKKRKSYTKEFKLEVVEMAESKSNRQAARVYHIDESSVRLWRRKKEDIDQMSCNQKSTRHGVPKWPDLEKELCDWIKDQRRKGAAVSTIGIRTMARTLAESRGVSGFVGGPSWCFRFMKRNGLFVRKRGNIEQEKGGSAVDNWVENRSLLKEGLLQIWAKQLLGQTLGNVGRGDEVVVLDVKQYNTVAVQTD